MSHADIYKDLDSVETAFKRLVNLIPRRGRIIAFDGMAGDAAECASLELCLSHSFCPIERYGTSEIADWKIAYLKLEAVQTSWSILHQGRPALGRFRVCQLSGRIQRVERNRCGGDGCKPTEYQSKRLRAALKAFKSVKRADWEVTALVNGITTSLTTLPITPPQLRSTLKGVAAGRVTCWSALV